MPRPVKHFLIALIVFVAEVMVATRFAHVGWIRSFLSDFLVVILIYHLVQSVREVPPRRLAIAVFLFACVVETAQYFHVADLLGFHRPSLIRTLIGTSFSWTDILMYLAGCMTSYFVDQHFMRQLRHHPASVSAPGDSSG
ncbi:DUF2809 domain-containing protein [uncultured Aquincola sp.]|uniref:ribosomal maturation YjgA family protein n=1 Tax=uncultured Aquincola sp. TaxID=886556 RepID=UPI0032B224CA